MKKLYFMRLSDGKIFRFLKVTETGVKGLATNEIATVQFKDRTPLTEIGAHLTK